MVNEYLRAKIITIVLLTTCPTYLTGTTRVLMDELVGLLLSCTALLVFPSSLPVPSVHPVPLGVLSALCYLPWLASKNFKSRHAKASQAGSPPCRQHCSPLSLSLSFSVAERWRPSSSPFVRRALLFPLPLPSCCADEEAP